MSDGPIYVLRRPQNHEQRSGPGYSWALPTRPDFPHFNGYMGPNPPRPSRPPPQQTPERDRRLEQDLLRDGRGGHAGGNRGRGRGRGRGGNHHQTHNRQWRDHSSGPSRGFPAGNRYHPRHQWKPESNSPQQAPKFIHPSPSPSNGDSERHRGVDHDQLRPSNQHGRAFALSTSANMTPLGQRSHNGQVDGVRTEPDLASNTKQRYAEQEDERQEDGAAQHPAAALPRHEDPIAVSTVKEAESRDSTSDSQPQAPASQSQESPSHSSKTRPKITVIEQVKVVEECIKQSSLFLDINQVSEKSESPFWNVVHAGLPDNLRDRFANGMQVQKDVGNWAKPRRNLLIGGCLEPPRDARYEIDHAIDRWNRIWCNRFCLLNKGLLVNGLWNVMEGEVRKMVCESVHESLSEDLHRTVRHLKKSGDWKLSRETRKYIDGLAQRWRGLAPHVLSQSKAVLELVASLQAPVGENVQDNMNDCLQQQSRKLRRRQSIISLESGSTEMSLWEPDALVLEHDQSRRESPFPATGDTPGRIEQSVEVKYRSVSRSPSPPIQPGTSCRVFKNGVWSTYEAPVEASSAADDSRDQVKTPSRKRRISREEETLATPETSGAKKRKYHDKAVQQPSRFSAIDNGASLTSREGKSRRIESSRDQEAVMSGANGRIMMSPSSSSDDHRSEDNEGLGEGSSPIKSKKHRSTESATPSETSLPRNVKKSKKKKEGDDVAKETGTSSHEKKKTKKRDSDGVVEANDVVDESPAPSIKKVKKAKRRPRSKSVEADGSVTAMQSKETRKKKDKSSVKMEPMTVINIDNSDGDDGDGASQFLSRSRESTYFMSLEEIVQSQLATNNRRAEQTPANTDCASSSRPSSRSATGSRKSKPKSKPKSTEAALSRATSIAAGTDSDAISPNRVPTPALSVVSTAQGSKRKASQELGEPIGRKSEKSRDASPALSSGSMELALRSRSPSLMFRQGTVERIRHMSEPEYRMMVGELYQKVKVLEAALAARD